MDEMCACGQPLHYSDPVTRQMVTELVDALGPDVPVEVPGVGSFRVPRHYIALHGVKAVDLPALAARYGWAHLPLTDIRVAYPGLLKPAVCRVHNLPDCWACGEDAPGEFSPSPANCSNAGHKVRWRTGFDDGCDTCGVTW